MKVDEEKSEDHVYRYVFSYIKNRSGSHSIVYYNVEAACMHRQCAKYCDYVIRNCYDYATISLKQNCRQFNALPSIIQYTAI